MPRTFASAPQTAHRRRRGARFALALGVSLALSRTLSAREQLRVRADTELVNLGLVRAPSTVEVSGVLRDDAGHPIGESSIVVTLPSEVAVRPLSCRPGDSPRVANGVVTVRTDALGFFCVRLPPDAPVEGRELRYDGDRFHSPTTARIPNETGKRRVALGFESSELVASLDSPSFVVWITTREVESGSTGDPVRLVLSFRSSRDGAEDTEVGVTDVQLGSTARFDVETRTLGAPGAGKLAVRFAGTSQLAPASETVLLTLRATAHLSLARAPQPSDPAEGVELAVGVGSALGAVGEGWVEAVAGGSSVGMSSVSGGAARVVATFGAPRGKPAQLMLRYIPASEGFVAEAPLLVEVPVRASSPWSGAPWMFGVAAIAYWVVRAWLRPSRRETRTAPRSEAPAGRAVVELLSTDLSRSGWRGHVVDAHDGLAIAGARVSIVVPVFDGEGVAAGQTTAADGSFALAHVAAARNDGARLVVSAPHHTTLAGPAPADGTLSICLVSRRRTLLDRLVAWASASPRPWGRGKEPTPLELAEAARRHAQPEVEGWAAAVAEAAYGPTSPDERRENEILGREPPLAGSRDER